jgi:murein DD-endopeptidase MepM/ murein hydrolase activator NlpD
VVLTRFDPPDRPWGSGHRGVDLAGAVDEPVRASGAGQVVYAGYLAGRGVVSVQHANGIRTTYEPVDPDVGRGEQVRAGQILGRLAAGHTSCAPAVCLHWGARTGPDAYLDPMLLVIRRPVRLLPWDGAPG